MSGSGPIYEYQRELTAKLEQALRERDEAVAAFHEATRLRSGIQQARIKAEDERDEARAMLSAICSEFERAVSHADWRAAGSPGMSVPFTGDFASATQIPSVVGRMRWWAREMRKAIGEKKS